MTKNIVIFDIDGTIADPEHRRDMVRDGNNNWKGFFDAAADDTVIEHTVAILELFYKDAYNIVLMTGRPETLRQVTEDWLTEHAINYDDLYMRPDKDSRPDEIVKEELFNQYLLKDKDKILLVVDDRPKVIRMWRGLGLNVLDCGNGVEF